MDSVDKTFGYLCEMYLNNVRVVLWKNIFYICFLMVFRD